MSICLNVPIMGWGDPVGFSIGSFTQWDLEVRIHGVANVPIWSSLIGFCIPFNG